MNRDELVHFADRVPVLYVETAAFVAVNVRTLVDPQAASIRDEDLAVAVAANVGHAAHAALFVAHATNVRERGRPRHL
jgi:hypothetical protein